MTALEQMHDHRHVLVRVAARYCGDQAEDAVQQALLIAVGHPDTIASASGWNWLCLVTKHEALRLCGVARRTTERHDVPVAE